MSVNPELARVSLYLWEDFTNLQAVEPDLGDLGAVAVDLLGGRDVGEEGDGGQPPPGEVQARSRGHSQSNTWSQITTLGHLVTRLHRFEALDGLNNLHFNILANVFNFPWDIFLTAGTK